MIEISIIVPIYNTEKYLDECLKSILKQTINKELIEVIMINDGSTDNSLKVINKYIKSNWILINQENKGLSYSRNLGIKISRGKYIMFLDSDDYINKKILKDMYLKIKKNKSDLVIGKIKAFDSKKTYKYYFDKVVKKEKNFYFVDNKKIIKTTSVCSKLYKKDKIINIKFIDNLKHEDNYFTAKLMLKNIKITTLPKYYYYRRYRDADNNSITQNLDINTLEDLIENYKKLWFDTTIDNYVFIFSLKVVLNYIIKNIENKNDGIILVNKYLRQLKDKKRISIYQYYKYKIYKIIYYKIGFIYYSRKVNNYEK